MAGQTAERHDVSVKAMIPDRELDQIVSELTRIWQELLGVPAITPDQNYFDLGGDSPLAVQLFARIEKSFDVKLPLATLFEAPTIEALADLLRQEPAESSWSSIVPIQPKGSRPPFFCVHGAGGNVLIYRDLSSRLGPDQPFYGLQSLGMDGSCAPLNRVEEMATLYAREIRKVQRHGPYYLGGYCLGGTIAFELARQLQAKGERIALLALFDTLNWGKIPLPTFWAKSYHGLERLFFHAANILRLDNRGKARFLSEKAKILRARLPVWRGMLLRKFSGKSGGSSESRVLSQIWLANDQAAMEYRPKSFAGTVTDFRPLRQYRWYKRPGTKWEALAEGGETIVELPVYPAGMLVEPFVQHLAGALEESITEAIERSRRQPTHGNLRATG